MVLSPAALRSTDVEIWKAQCSSTSPHLLSSLALDSAHVQMWNSIEFSLMCQTETLGPPGSKIKVSWIRSKGRAPRFKDLTNLNLEI